MRLHHLPPMMVSRSRISQSLQFKLLMLISLRHQHLYPSSALGTAIPSNRISMNMKSPMCLEFERVNWVAKLSRYILPRAV